MKLLPWTSKWNALAILVAVAASAFALRGFLEARELEWRLERSQSALADAREREDSLASELEQARAALAARAGSPPVAQLPAAPAAPVEVVIAPDGQRLRSPEEYDAYLRAHLSQQIARAFDDELDETEREAAVDLLARIRALRSAELGLEAGQREDPAVRDQLIEAQQELIELTGMGVGDFVQAMDEGGRAVPRAPGSAGGPVTGEERRRFADEAARVLGIAASGSSERFEDGEWVER